MNVYQTKTTIVTIPSVTTGEGATSTLIPQGVPIHAYGPESFPVFETKAKKPHLPAAKRKQIRDKGKSARYARRKNRSR